MATDKRIDGLVKWIATQVQEAGATGAVLGLSGGLDSAVTAALCKRALGRDKVLAIFIPFEYGREEEDDVRLVAGAAGVCWYWRGMGPCYAEFVRGEQASLTADGNVKSRLRMAMLYFLANIHNSLVVGTSNKSEIMVGYSTKYGDGAADILPLGNLYKTEVRELAPALGIPQRIIDKPPSAGLYPGQTDEGELGMSYEVLDEALKAFEGEDSKTDLAVYSKVAGLVIKAHHKHVMPPKGRW